MFEEIPSSQSGINFNNEVTESDSINPLDVVNIYNGGGVGIGDFNNDGLQDIYFTGNMVSSKLYLNTGGFKFKDITNEAGVDGMGRWARGVAVVDINNDGLEDIYICNTIYKDSSRRCNILYVNQGIDKNGTPHFKDMAAAYGLNVNVQSTMAAFFDYDNDGDLDMYLTVNEASTGYDQSVFTQRNNIVPEASSKGRLYRNDMNATLKHPVFHDVSEQAGIIYSGFGHGATICDINNDGWKDIYVADDFISSNLLYINNQNGTFSERSQEYFKHTSFNSMGQDIADINNDGLPDVIELDMNPEDNFRKKMMLNAGSYMTLQNFEAFGYQYQYVRNTLQLNQGPILKEGDSVGRPAFSEIGFLTGIAQTDWSWTPLVADFDNDGFRDIIITNGFPKDVSDRDFISYRKDAAGLASKKDVLAQIPQIKIHNYAYRNNGDLSFTDATNNWGLLAPTYSNGAAYADFDNDGAMDMVINDINGKALLYRNTVKDKDTAARFLQIKFKGGLQNINGFGAMATIYYQGKKQAYENNPYRGYLSTIQNTAHFGLGNITLIDSVVIRWDANTRQILTHIKTNQAITVDIKDAQPDIFQPVLTDTNSLFKEITKTAGITYKHTEADFIDFNIQKLLPHKLSQYSPALAAADIDDNGLDDIIVGGNFNRAQVLLQQQDGRFIQRNLLSSFRNFNSSKDEGVLIFDANGDNKPDVYIASGGYQFSPGSINYQDRLFINDGNGNFKEDSSALPRNYTSKFCVRAFDYNNDGKPDLFVSGRVEPWQYPKAVSSFIFRNDSKNNKAKFTDVTDEVAPGLKNIGLVSDALFSDFDNDGKTDLILVGEWMPITFLRNENGKFNNVTQASGIAGKTGWWNSIVAGDFRHTGRTDYIVGNVGLNTLYRASDKYPVYITAKDFEGNGNYNAIPSLFLPATLNGEKKEFPVPGRDDMIREMVTAKRKFTSYKSYATATMDSVIPAAMRKDALRLKATEMASCYIRNDGNGKFTILPLPIQAQFSVVNGMIADDFDGDGNLDFLINGNDFGTELSIGRYDALNGLLLKGDGKGNFQPLSILQSGIYVPGDGKALVKLQGANGHYLVAASQHSDYMKLFQLRNNQQIIKMKPDDISALIHYKNGAVQKMEFYYGTSFLSQSSRFIIINDKIENVTVTNGKGEVRNLDLK
ncbi:VCBS repeat-containing protein [Parafilimonas terrae]|uniref:VCBS repeat-containing protein n=1 Tax=Parafilimonas terrae TaxID=1465490 RepID=UPI001FDEF1E0|nr:VCBS repeat-containing protein [Parafilimonas terrae]